jgi:hypothetical protein
MPNNLIKEDVSTPVPVAPPASFCGPLSAYPDLFNCAKLVEQGLGVSEIRGVEPFGKPGEDVVQQLAGVTFLALALPQSSKAHSRDKSVRAGRGFGRRPCWGTPNSTRVTVQGGPLLCNKTRRIPKRVGMDNYLIKLRDLILIPPRVIARISVQITLRPR